MSLQNNYSTARGMPWEQEALKQWAERHLGPLKWKGSEGQAKCKLPTHNGQDQNPSFCFNTEKGTGHCFACHAAGEGLSVKDLAAALGVPLPPPAQEHQAQKPTRKIVKIYDYADAAGNLVYQSCRFEPKGFAQRRPDGKGSYHWNLDGVEPLPYRLPELLAALEAGKMVVIVEGEKDADRLRGQGITATTNSGGAGKWPERHSKYFATSAKVLVIPDNDTPGRNHAQAVARALHDRGCIVRVVELPGLPEKGDVSDWLDAGHTKTELSELAKAAPIWTPETAPAVAEDPAADECAVPWPEPTPLRRSTDPPEFPTDALPCDIGNFVNALSEFAQTPTGLAASMVLAIMAAALAGKVEIKARAGYTEPLNLYVLALMPPASRKSSVLNEITKPLRDFEKDAIAKARPEVAQSESQYKRLKKKLEFLENAYAKGTGTKKPKQKTGEEANLPAVADAVQVSDIDRLAADLAEFKVKKLPQYIIQDITAERTASKLDENSGVLALFSPEGELIENAKGRYSKGFNFEVYLKAHAGDPLRVDRENPEKKPIYVDRPLLTIGICAQPDVVTELPAAFSGRGLLARFLYCVPASNIGQRKVKTEPVPLGVAAGYYGCIKKLLDIPIVTDESGRRDEVQFTLNREATSLLDEFAEDVEKALGDPERLGALPEWGGKFVGAVLRIAGLLHAADNAGNIDAMLRPIQSDTLLRAIRIGDFFMEHAKTAFSIMKTSETVVNAEFILSWLRRGQIREIQRKTLLDKLRGRFRTAAELDEPLKMLCEYDWIREKKIAVPGTHKPKTIYEVNISI